MVNETQEDTQAQQETVCGYVRCERVASKRAMINHGPFELPGVEVRPHDVAVAALRVNPSAVPQAIYLRYG